MKTLFFAYALAILLLAVRSQEKARTVPLPRTELEVLQPTQFADAPADSTTHDIMLPDVEDNPDIALPKYKCFYNLKNTGTWVRDAQGRKYWQPAPLLRIEVPCDCEAIHEGPRMIG
jgi:hypothetical protein